MGIIVVQYGLMGFNVYVIFHNGHVMGIPWNMLCSL